MTYHIIFPGTRANSIRVSDIDPKFTNKHEKKKPSISETGKLHHQMVGFRYILYKEQKRSLLFIFQVQNAGGKDGLFILSVQ